MVDPELKKVGKKSFLMSSKSLFLKLGVLVEEKKHAVHPSGSHLFAAFDHTPFDKVKVVVQGKVYHGAKQAHGLSFSVQDGIAHPPSLQNIFKN